MRLQAAEAEAKESDKPAKRKGNVYVDPKRKKKEAAQAKRPRRERKESTGGGAGDDNEPRARAPRAGAAGAGVDAADAIATHLRASTKKLTRQKQAEREREQEEQEIRRATRPARRSGGGDGPRLSQEQLLAEAKRTEEANRASLEILLRIEEERKRVGPVVPALTGPMVRFRSDRSATTVTFADTPLPSPPFGLPAPTAPAPRVCVVTGLPARYTDPKTGQAYATAAALRTLRERAAAVKVQALSALLEEKRRKRDADAARSGAAATPVSPVAPSPSPLPAPAAAASASASAAATPEVLPVSSATQ